MPGDATHHARSPQIPRWFHKKCGIVSQGFLNAGSGNWFPAHVANHGYHAALRGESIKGTWLILCSGVMAAEAAVVVFPGYFVVDYRPLTRVVPWPLLS